MTPRDEAFQRLAEYLTEQISDVRARRAGAASRSGWAQFWNWLGQNVTSVSLIVTIITAGVGGFWAVRQYLGQQRAQMRERADQAGFEKNRTIAALAGDL